MKKISFFSTVLITSLILTGCTQTPPAQPTGMETSSSLESYGDENDVVNDIKLDEKPEGTQQLTNEAKKGSSMKTLADFEKISATQATITTNKGDITFELYGDKTPITVANFLNLAKSGFYNGIKFHRIIPDFMAQVGDPLTKDDSKKAMWGSGDPGYKIPDEFHPTLKHDSEGIVSMANAGPNTGGSQIFITYGPQPHLDGMHTVFGKVTSGMEVLRTLQMGDVITSVTYK